jgi:hypothetical protein
MKFSSGNLTVAATFLFATAAFALNAPGRLEATDAVQKVADQRAQEKATTTGVGAPGTKVGPSTGATPPATQAGSQDTSTPRASKVGPTDNPAEPINPEHPSPNNQPGRR